MTLFKEVSEESGIGEDKVKTSVNAFERSVRQILLLANDVHLKGLFSITLRPNSRKRVMERGRSLLDGRRRFTKSHKRNYMRKLRKSRKNNEKKL